MDGQQHSQDTTVKTEPPLEEVETMTQSNPTSEDQVAGDLDSLLGVGMVNQDDLERDIMAKASKALDAKDNELDKKRLEKTLKNAKHVSSTQNPRLIRPSKVRLEIKKLEGNRKKLDRSSFALSNLEERLGELNEELAQAEKDEQDIKDRIRGRRNGAPLSTSSTSTSSGQQDGESHREYLIRTGKITPFAAVSGLEKSKQDAPSGFTMAGPSTTDQSPKSHVHLPRPSWSLIGKESKAKNQKETSRSSNAPAERSSMRKARNKIASRIDRDDDDDFNDSVNGDDDYNDSDALDPDFVNPEGADSEVDSKDDRAYSDIPETSEDDDFKSVDQLLDEKSLKKRTKGGTAYKFLCEDDGDEMHYQKRLSDWAQKRRHLRWRVNHPDASMETDLSESWENPEQKLDPAIEMYNPHPNMPDAELEGGYKIPGDIYSNLFDYQKTCTQWLWELHCQGAGGIIGDEMGLGKTIQIISFLAGLLYSGKLDAPIIIVCPATLLKQWVKEFHRWWPPMRVAILHSSGSGMHSKVEAEEDLDADSFSDGYSSGGLRKKRKAKKRFGGGPRRGRTAAEAEERTVADDIVDRISAKGHVIVTTYAGLRIHSSRLLRKNWSYIVLDEGHKIRNPDADITLTCKQFRTPHRIILSGTPIQNNLNELWSLFDFVFPGRLGTLPVFQSQFAIPINLGGYANASNIQRAAYEKFIKSDELTSIMEGKRHALYGIDLVRKICNHADILGREHHKDDPGYGDYKKSGKMVVVKALLQMWQKEKHRVLLFSQTRTMLDILEKFIKSEGYVYRRMDGMTPIQNRMGLVDEYNARDDIYVFLLTTKVGGLGVNLTGADRVIIFDPDWNPSTDIQARERAWRLGQTRAVTIYRLMTSGTIEEKIYHRQIFKQFLTNKILKDPKQRRFFKSHDMADLFSLEGENAVGTETGGIFQGSEVSIKTKPSKGKGRSKRGGDSLDELSRLDGVRKVEKFNVPRESSSLPGGVKGEEDEELNFRPNKDSAGETSHEGSEVNILASLFESSGVHSALKHDEIMDAAKQENLIVEREATRVAERAMAALKESRKRRRRQDLDVPTWTGKSGSAGAPKTFLMHQQSSSSAVSSTPKPRFGTANTFNPSVAAALNNGNNGSLLKFGRGAAGTTDTSRPQSGFGASSLDAASSSSLLAGMMERKRLEQESSSAVSTSSRSSSRDSSPTISDAFVATSVLQDGTRENLIMKIRDYMLDHGGRVRSADLVAHFQHQLAEIEQIVFKKMLRGIAVFERSVTDGQGWWKLKPDYY
ncbi:hypothetical protein BGZ54_005705 [Gamsiella multidivaricata]|nr:hypothetical protein BGZ54_005705 [Gamsiella multidivaricata]